MAYSYKKKENIGNKSTEYSRYYSAFRGVDFSSDHTQVHESRLAYLVNMYKDYQSGQGEALETVAGFRRRAKFNDSEVFGIFYFKCEVDGAQKERVLVHSGKGLYLWHNYPYSINISTTATIVAQEPNKTTRVGETDIKTYTQQLGFPCEEIINLKSESGEDIAANATYDKATNTLTFTSSIVEQGEMLELSYYEGVSLSSDMLFTDMNERKSASFICNNRLYIIDGKNYLVFDGKTVARVKDNAYIPTTYIGIIPSGENADNGSEYEPRNMLTPKFKTTFKATGDATEYFLNENDLDSVISVKVYGEELSANDYTVDLANGKITFKTAPKKPEETAMKDENGNLIPYDGAGAVPDANGQGKYLPYEEGHFGVEITAAKTWTTLDGVKQETDIADIISGCTLCTTFDDRVFLSGNPNYHNLLFWCRLTSGYANPSYFSVIDWVPDGVGSAPITGLMCVSDTLMVLKADTQQDSSIYFHTGETGDNMATRVYPKKQGLSGLGCVGACRNFLDDPIFISRLGVE
ncbi:MAG: hypothetical protein IKZ28_05525, partial [Clostridia bacterium]|nr:hypothetical protein [Clostridia bacterium]